VPGGTFRKCAPRAGLKVREQSGGRERKVNGGEESGGRERKVNGGEGQRQVLIKACCLV